ncbi:hypothetical protein KR074_005546 [Drosophila pseudoananassae]|nr:hypothetical protein KR074_005546 [Drosophila pseudoananassae]
MNKGNSNNKSNKAQKSRPNILGTEPSNINARLNRIYGNLQTAASPSQVKVLRRPWQARGQQKPELETEEHRRLRERSTISNNFLEDSKNHQEKKKKEYDNGNGKKKDEKIQKKVRFVGVPCICQECGNSHISGDNDEAGQNPASPSTKNRELSWEEWVASNVSDDKDGL